MSEVADICQKHDDWRANCINLIPSENVMSRKARNLLASDMATRYTLPINAEVHGSFVENVYRGTKFMDEVEELANSLARDIFGVKHVTFAPLSGHVAAITAVSALCEKGDLIMSLPSEGGGYDGYLKDYIPDMLAMDWKPLPFDAERWNLDVVACVEAIQEHRPKLVVLGASFFPFPHDVASISAACKEVDGYLAYDGCHVLGLIAGGEFQDPLAEGADVLIGNTHKSFFGPQGGCLLANDDSVFEKIRANITWRTVDNIHRNRIAATAQALLELRDFGKDYARQIVRNSRALALYLDSRDIWPLFRELKFTKSHQILLDYQRFQEQWNMDLNTAAKTLEGQNIITDAVGRIGTNEITRLGMKEGEMGRVAEFIERAFSGENVRNEVIAFRSGFDVAFC